jgi:hypothetical protein
MKKFGVMLVVCVLGAVLYVAWLQDSNRNVEEANIPMFSLFPTNPLNATFLHNGENLTFENGTYNDEHHTLITTRDPVYGDVDGDGTEDAVFIFTDQNEGTFYLALALNDETGFLGLETVPLEVENEPVLHINNEIISVSGDNSNLMYYILTGTTLSAYEADGTLTPGTYVFDGEQQTFTPCGSSTTYSISPTSPALPVLTSIYTERRNTIEGTHFVYVVITGNVVTVPTEGADLPYDSAYEILTVVKAPKMGRCALTGAQTEETATST